MIDFHSMPVTEETVAKLHGLILALAMRSETHDVSAAKIIEEEWKRVEDVWARKD